MPPCPPRGRGRPGPSGLRPWGTLCSSWWVGELWLRELPRSDRAASPSSGRSPGDHSQTRSEASSATSCQARPGSPFSGPDLMLVIWGRFGGWEAPGRSLWSGSSKFPESMKENAPFQDLRGASASSHGWGVPLGLGAHRRPRLKTGSSLPPTGGASLGVLSPPVPQRDEGLPRDPQGRQLHA